MEKSNIPEEVTITPVIRDIERLFLRLFVFIKTSCFFLAKVLVKLIEHCIKHFLILAIVVIIGGLAGYFSERLIPTKFVSTMVLEPNIEVKEQLFNDVFYLNSLMDKRESESLSNLFGISEEEAQTLVGMELISIDSEIDKLRIVDQFYKKLDTATRRNFNFARVLESNDDLFSNRFAINIIGVDAAIFSKLELKFIAFLERIPELQMRRKATVDLLVKKKSFYLEQLDDLDTLKKVSNTSILKQSEKTLASPVTSISLAPQRNSESMNILDVYDRSNNYFNEIVVIESELFNLKTCYRVLAKLNDYGVTVGLSKLKRTVIGAGSLFLLVLIITGTIKIIGFSRKSDV